MYIHTKETFQLRRWLIGMDESCQGHDPAIYRTIIDH